MKEYRQKERALIRARRQAANAGNFFIEPAAKVAFVVRIRGSVDRGSTVGEGNAAGAGTGGGSIQQAQLAHAIYNQPINNKTNKREASTANASAAGNAQGIGGLAMDSGSP